MLSSPSPESNIQTPNSDPAPHISVILPMRNEVRYLARCLDAVCQQDYPREQIEILVCDGASDDGTRELVNKYVAQDVRVQLLDNPKRIVPTALNIGLRRARGEVIIRVDGHAVIEKDYVRLCVEDLAQVDTDCVGGPIETIGETPAARAIALAQSSPFGVGGAAFRYAQTAQYVDTLAFGAYRREVFDKIGLFDEELVRNQDDEFNFRLLRAGGKIWLDPRIRSRYYSRSTLRGLWKQYYEYGFWKVRVMQKHGRPMTLRSLAPGALVLILLGGIIASIALYSSLPFLLIVGAYVVGTFFAALWTVLMRDRTAPLFDVQLAFVILHVAYGLGFWWGMIRWNMTRHGLE